MTESQEFDGLYQVTATFRGRPLPPKDGPSHEVSIKFESGSKQSNGSQARKLMYKSDQCLDGYGYFMVGLFVDTPGKAREEIYYECHKCHSRILWDGNIAFRPHCKHCRSHMQRIYNCSGIPGCIIQKQNRKTGLLYSIYFAEQAGIDPTLGCWVTMCETHGSFGQHNSLGEAERHLPKGDWCPECCLN